MMTPDVVHAKLQDGQHAMLDWAMESDDMAHIAETMVAMANYKGGTVIMGVYKGKVEGVGDTQS
ncbi:MAG: RNA-binding domain-containing protein, partial [Chloroflexota bacterium]